MLKQIFHFFIDFLTIWLYSTQVILLKLTIKAGYNSSNITKLKNTTMKSVLFVFSLFAVGMEAIKTNALLDQTATTTPTAITTTSSTNPVTATSTTTASSTPTSITSITPTTATTTATSPTIAPTTTNVVSETSAIPAPTGDVFLNADGSLYLGPVYGDATSENVFLNADGSVYTGPVNPDGTPLI